MDNTKRKPVNASLKVFCIFLVAFVFVLVSPYSSFAKGKTYRDSDWNSSAYDNCGLPVTRGEKRSVALVKIDGDRKVRMTLREGEVGRCSTDAKARHSAPFWERAELRQDGYLKIGKVHRLKFEAIFQEGFRGRRETFFQVHGWNGNCHAYPPLMMMFDREKLTIWALRNVSGDGISRQNRGSHKDVASKLVSINSLLGKPSKFEVEFDTRRQPGRLSVLLNGRAIVQSTSIGFANCAKPYFKFGVYRPGGSGSKTSTVLFDNIIVETVQK